MNYSYSQPTACIPTSKPKKNYLISKPLREYSTNVEQNATESLLQMSESEGVHLCRQNQMKKSNTLWENQVNVNVGRYMALGQLSPWQSKENSFQPIDENHKPKPKTSNKKKSRTSVLLRPITDLEEGKKRISKKQNNNEIKTEAKARVRKMIYGSECHALKKAESSISRYETMENNGWKEAETSEFTAEETPIIYESMYLREINNENLQKRDRNNASINTNIRKKIRVNKENRHIHTEAISQHPPILEGVNSNTVSILDLDLQGQCIGQEGASRAEKGEGEGENQENRGRRNGGLLDQRSLMKAIASQNKQPEGNINNYYEECQQIMLPMSREGKEEKKKEKEKEKNQHNYSLKKMLKLSGNGANRGHLGVDRQICSYFKSREELKQMMSNNSNNLVSKQLIQKFNQVIHRK